MTPEEAADFGLIDEVVFQRPESEEDEGEFGNGDGEDEVKD